MCDVGISSEETRVDIKYKVVLRISTMETILGNIILTCFMQTCVCICCIDVSVFYCEALHLDI